MNATSRGTSALTWVMVSPFPGLTSARGPTALESSQALSPAVPSSVRLREAARQVVRADDRGRQAVLAVHRRDPHRGLLGGYADRRHPERLRTVAAHDLDRRRAGQLVLRDP